MTKPKTKVEERQLEADKLLLSILVIPAVTVESQQSKDIQEKLSAMMISSTKVPDRSELEELMVSKGVLENASENIITLLLKFNKFAITLHHVITIICGH